MIEGVGSGIVYGNLKNAKVHQVLEISDETALSMMVYLYKNEGFFCGGSSGLNVAGACIAAKSLPEGSTVVTVLCDYGEKYVKKIWGEGLETLGIDANEIGDDLDFL